MSIQNDIEGIVIEGKNETDNKMLPEGVVYKLNDLFRIKHNEFVKIFRNKRVCIYGEGYGKGIRKGGKYSKDQNFVVFDINIDGWWLSRKNVEDICIKLGLQVVPVVGSGTLFEMIKLVKKGFDSKWGNFLAEGIVAKPEIELKTRAGERIITKIKYSDFIKIQRDNANDDLDF